MIVVGIGSVVILGIMATMDYQNKVSKTGEVNRQVDEIKRQIQTWISNQAICDLTFGGLKQGELLGGLKTKNEGTADDYVIKTGDRFPASNWTIQQMELMNYTNMKTMFPNFGAQVGDNGMGMGVLHVQLAQLSGSSGNTLMTAGQDRGSFTTLSKDIYFPISAYFGSPEPVTVWSCSELDPTNSSGACCAGCAMPGAGVTWAQYIQNQTGLAVGSSNRAVFTSSYDTGQPNDGCTSVIEGGVQMWQGVCNAFNINMPIMSCFSTAVDPMAAYK